MRHIDFLVYYSALAKKAIKHFVIMSKGTLIKKRFVRCNKISSWNMCAEWSRANFFLAQMATAYITLWEGQNLTSFTYAMP